MLESDDAGRAKLNALIDWTWADVWHHIQTNEVPYNPLHDAFMPSIGCAPCTRAIAVGEDFRAGRWWWENASAKECGLHSSTHAEAQAKTAISSLPL
jgi:phosphoadenosine phosphosulfate reductase